MKKVLHIKGPREDYNFVSDKVNIETITMASSDSYKGIQEFIKVIANYEFDGILTSETLGDDENYTGLELCIRIRLSAKELGSKTLSTLFVYSSSTPHQIYKTQLRQKTSTTASVLFTLGTFIFDDQSSGKILIENNSNYNILTSDNFATDFLDALVLKRPPNLGNHSLSNIWGILRLANVTGHTDILEQHFLKHSDLSQQFDNLYLKYILSYSAQQDTDPVDKKTIDSEHRNVLFIDDEERNGWSILLKNIFLNANFEPVAVGENFLKVVEEKIKETSDGLPKWDLILLDLRLMKNEDFGKEAHMTAVQYSGASILKKIKAFNAGLQVIMFTASNKAWNMKELQELGADGFYIKESPEFSKEISFSVNNFNSFFNQTRKCFKNHFLKEIYHYGQKVIIKLNGISSVGGGAGLMALSKQKLKSEVLLQVRQGFELLKSGQDNEFNFTLAFLSYFKIIELLNDYFLEYDPVNYKFIHKSSGATIQDCKFENGRYSFSNKSRWEQYKASTPLKFYNVLQSELGFSITTYDKSLAQRVYQYNALRNDVIHPKDLSKYGKATMRDNLQIIRDVSKCIDRLT